MRFIRRKSDGKREGHFTFRGISWMTLPIIEISLIAFCFLVIKGIKITQVYMKFQNSRTVAKDKAKPRKRKTTAGQKEERKTSK